MQAPTRICADPTLRDKLGLVVIIVGPDIKIDHGLLIHPLEVFQHNVLIHCRVSDMKRSSNS